ncbi:hypothetical protein [Pedobacter gandavensis]|uniref:hypothetical protein n=1 Tax=Pedobacter gandavensis TaxID=2679963 RepID=UPI00292DAFA2|nr:hypothetical protein [Pedobacter gandavensis]
MQAMQDKDFDQLFKDKFEGAEIRPSANLWSNIEKELTPKKNNVFPVYWLAAAAVAVIAISVGLLSPEAEKIQLQGKTKEVAVVESSSSNLTEGTTVANRLEDAITEEGTPLVLAPKTKLRNLVQENNLVALQRNERIKRHQIKAVEVKIPLKEEIATIAQVPTENVIANVTIPNVEEADNVITETEGREERRGIRNVGDVINFVVDKLDKREKKLIQFKTDDDDNSSLVALNIGILKFNPKRNK